ncbi:MAG: DUF1917 domain-containing protein [Asgard group archaeon]|nr:DUF1917 domain-containing protein [Asgard group archaeon]
MKCSRCGLDSANIADKEKNLCQMCFLEDNLPSKYTKGFWILVFNQKSFADKKKKKKIGRVASFRKKGEVVEVLYKNNAIKTFKLTHKNLDFIAKESNKLIGKWLVYESPSKIDQLWLKIAKATIDGELGITAKVSTALSEIKEHFVICVYTENYFDLEDVNRVRDKLTELGITQTLYYKPDLYTYLGIYENTTCLEPYRYKS